MHAKQKTTKAMKAKATATKPELTRSTAKNRKRSAPTGQEAVKRLRPYHHPSVKVPVKVIIVSSDDKPKATSVKIVNVKCLQKPGELMPCGGLRPTDSHQDDIVVNSIEMDGSSAIISEDAGVNHYLAALDQTNSHENISVTFCADIQKQDDDDSNLLAALESRRPDQCR